MDSHGYDIIASSNGLSRILRDSHVIYCFSRADNTEEGARQPGALQSALRQDAWEPTL